MKQQRERQFSIFGRLLFGLSAIVVLVLVLVVVLVVALIIDHDRDQTIAIAAVGSVAVLVVTAGLSISMLRALRHPLAAVDEVAAAVNDGDLDQRVPRLAAREIDQLGQGVNQMLDTLSANVAEANLQRQRTAAIVDSVSEGIVVIDAAGSVTNINPAAARMFETSISEARDRPAIDLGFFTAHEVREIINHARTGAVQPIVRRRGERVLSAAVSTLKSDESEASSGSVWVLRDVTELAQIDEMKSEFISIVSHELRTPLTAIKGFTDLILEGEVGDISAQQREFLEIVQSNSDRLVGLINDMLDISRIESGRITLNTEELDIADTIRQAIAALRPLIEDKQLRLQTELADDPDGVVADRARLQQILTNLISNACKYTLPGGWITIRTEALHGQIAVSISDTGIGIPAEALPQIFSKFYRVDQPQTREVGGSGLGLAITKSLVEMHGGKIAIASRPGVGTTVRFTLPTTQLADGSSNGASETTSRSGVVLIVSGDASERSDWESAIRSLQAEVVIARGNSAAATVGEADLHHPSVIVVRCGEAESGLPELDELLLELDATPGLRTTPIVAVGAETTGAQPYDGVLLTRESTAEEVARAVSHLLPQGFERGPQRGRILVAEDDVDMANWIRRVLVRNGFEVTLVRDGLAAIVRAIEILPDAVILDVNMPKMGASEVLPQLLGNPGTREIPIIVISGTVPDSGPFFIQQGATDFFSKPFNGDRLVHRLIELSRKRQDVQDHRH